MPVAYPTVPEGEAAGDRLSNRQTGNLINDLFDKGAALQPATPESNVTSTVIPLHPRNKHLH